jgi:hypothetical protein
MVFLTKTNGYQKICDTNKNVKKLEPKVLETQKLVSSPD